MLGGIGDHITKNLYGIWSSLLIRTYRLSQIYILSTMKISIDHNYLLSFILFIDFGGGGEIVCF